MSISKTFVAHIFAVAAEMLSVGSFQKRKPGIFTLGLNAEIIGWVGLNTAHCRDGVTINPVIGVRHQKLERLIAELLDTKPIEYIPPSLSTPVGYLMPQKEFMSWSFKEGDDYKNLAGEMIAAVEKFGRPFMEQNSTLETLYKTLLNSKHGTPPDQIDYRIAVASFLLGKHTETEAFINTKLKEIGSRSDAAAEMFKNFATALREKEKVMQ